MIVRFTGQGDDMTLLHGKEYEVMSIECGWYRILDESGEDYLYPPQAFDTVIELPTPPTKEPSNAQESDQILTMA